MKKLHMALCNDYPPGDNNTFTGTVKWVRIDLGSDSYDHLLDPEQVFAVAMARQ